MKTLDEVLEMQMYAVGDKTKADQVADKLQKFRDLGDEVAANDRVKNLIMALAAGTAAGQLTLGQALMTAFVNGLATGMEMEKAE